MTARTFSPVHRRPALLAVDSQRARIRRYWPKHPRGFLIDEVDILPDAELGSPDGRRQVESFRQDGLRTVHPPSPSTEPDAA